MAAAAALGSVVQGVTGFMQSQYQAKVANMNANVALWNAERTRVRTGIDAQEKDYLETRAVLGEQEVAQAASGVSLAGKSQIATRNSARLLGRRDTQNIVEEGQMERYNHLVEAANFKAEKSAAKISGVSSLVGGVLGAASAMAGSSMAGGAQASPAQAKYPPKPVLKPQPFKTAPVAAKSTLMRPRPNPPMGFTFPSFNLMKRRTYGGPI
jgi:hypothetical protein